MIKLLSSFLVPLLLLSCELNQQKINKMEKTKIKEKNIQTLVKGEKKNKLTYILQPI